MNEVNVLPSGPVTFIGFDSAWVDNPKSPGAICSVVYDGVFRNFEAPRLVGFAGALDYIRDLAGEQGPLLLALQRTAINKQIIASSRS